MTLDEELGRALARLVRQNEGGAPAYRLVSAGQKRTMQMLRDRLRERAQLKETDRPVPIIPGKECAQEGAYLEGNVDFFLDHLMSRNLHTVCPKLIKHINDCYRCFEIYAGVMRGFTLEPQVEASNPEKGTD